MLIWLCQAFSLLSWVKILPTKIMINRLKEENSAIKKRIEHKEELVSEYSRLITERQELIEREKKLDAEIAVKMATLQEVMQKGEETGYGRR